MISRTVGFYGVKVSAIFIMSVVHFIVGSVLSDLLNDAIPATNLHEISTLGLMGILSAVFGGIGVVFYIVRILIKRMPFFLDGIYGFKYSLLQEAAGGMIIGYTMYAYLDNLQNMMEEFRKRLRSEEQVISEVVSTNKSVVKESDMERPYETAKPYA